MEAGGPLGCNLGPVLIKFGNEKVGKTCILRGWCPAGHWYCLVALPWATPVERNEDVASDVLQSWRKLRLHPSLRCARTRQFATSLNQYRSNLGFRVFDQKFNQHAHLQDFQSPEPLVQHRVDPFNQTCSH